MSIKYYFPFLDSYQKAQDHLIFYQKENFWIIQTKYQTSFYIPTDQNARAKWLNTPIQLSPFFSLGWIKIIIYVANTNHRYGSLWNTAVWWDSQHSGV